MRPRYGDPVGDAVILAQSLFYVDGRHRWAIEPLLLVVAAVGAATVVSVLRGRLPRPASFARAPHERDRIVEP